ncbi:MAG TPA: Hsp70 family protein [Myxococcales bacterium]
MTSAGIDFGTSNSAAAVPGKDDEPARVLDIDESAADRRLLRSVLFFPDGSADILAGALAIDRYLEDFEGRFLQSIKTFLPSTAFTQTEIRRKSWKLEQLIAVLLTRIRESVERELSGKLSQVVFGRPAVFSPDPEKDALAQARLAQAAVLAGFPEPVFVIEPIAAALRYEESLAHDEVVLVGDFGAGTSDFTLMQLGPSRRRAKDRRPDVISSSGVYVGGDKFDAAIVQHRLLAEFGAGSTYSTLFKRTELPHWMTRKLLAWNELSMLREKSNLDFLRNAVKTSDKPRELQNLVTLAEENLPFHLYRVVEEAKRNLSAEPKTKISFHEAGIDIEASVSRKEFEHWTAPLRQELLQAVERCLAKASGLVPDAVFLTGGTSKIPSVRQAFAERFGESRLREGDAFTSVAAGLGRAAGLLAAGGSGMGRGAIG